MGDAYGRTSPVRTYSPTLYLEVEAPVGAALALPRAEELALYVVAGTVSIEGQHYGEGRLAVAAPGADIVLQAVTAARLKAWENFIRPSSFEPTNTSVVVSTGSLK